MKIDIDAITFEDIQKELEKEKKSKKGAAVSPTISTEIKRTSLKNFFESKGLKTIDLRGKNGCLWVLGSQKDIGHIVSEAIEKYGVSGGFSSGRATGYKPAWWTKSEK